MTAVDPQLAAAVAKLGALPMPVGDRLTAEREAEILKFRDQCHPVTGVLAVGRVHRALDDLLAELDAVRAELEQARTRLTTADVASWLNKKAREYPTAPERQEDVSAAIGRLADKVSRGAIRPNEQAGGAK